MTTRLTERGRGRCQIQCQMGEFGGGEGDPNSCSFSNLLIQFPLQPGSNPSLSASKNRSIRGAWVPDYS
jgi:hypothetical protein